jgi:hypothetical protein
VCTFHSGALLLRVCALLHIVSFNLSRQIGISVLYQKDKMKKETKEFSIPNEEGNLWTKVISFMTLHELR